MDYSELPVRAGSSSGHARYLQTKMFGSLDGLRALSILAVVWHHANGWDYELRHRTNAGFADWPIAWRGFFGVELFFIISGFLIVTLLLRERRRTNAISLRSFYLRRCLRIFPAYYLMLLMTLVVSYLKPGSNSANISRELPFAFFYVSNLVPMHGPLSITWSLAAEEQFYLIVPALENYAWRAFSRLLPLTYALISLPQFGFFPGLELPSFFRESSFAPIILGVALAHALDDPQGYAILSRALKHWSSPLFASALVLALLACNYPGKDVDGLPRMIISESVTGWPRMIINWSLLVLVATCVIRERHALLPILSFRPLRRIGMVSYGIYLYHGFALYIAYWGLHYCNISLLLPFFVTSALGAWILAEISYRLLESRFLALKTRLARDAGVSS